MNLKKICTVISFTLIGTTGVNAAILTNASNEVYSLQLNDGGYAWSGVTSDLRSNASDTTNVSAYTYSVDRNRETVIEVTPAQVGVPGSVDVLDVSTTTTTNHTDTVNRKSELSDIDFGASISGIQTTPSEYILSGSILRNSQYGVLDGSFGSFGFSASMDVNYLGETPYVAESMTGTVTIEFESGVNRWSSTHQQDFLSDGHNFLSIGDGKGLDLADTVFFTAIFAIDGSSLSYGLDRISLNAYTRDSESTLLNRDIEILVDEQRTLLLSEEIPALEPPTAVPLPAAVWLLGSGLLALVGVARRRN